MKRERRQGYQPKKSPNPVQHPVSGSKPIITKAPPVGGLLIKTNIDNLRLEIATELLINTLNNKAVPKSQLEGVVDQSIELADMLITKVGIK